MSITTIPLSSNKAFTLIELIITMGILSIIVGIMVHVYTRHQSTLLSQNQIVQMQQNLRAAMTIMTQEIQMAGFDPSGLKRAGIIKMGDGSYGNPLAFTYYDKNISNDGLDGELQLIQYALYDAYSDNDMDIGRKSGSGNNQAIAENIQNLRFTYLDANSNQTVEPTKVRAIRITITANTDIKERSKVQNNHRTLTTVIKLRNLFY